MNKLKLTIVIPTYNRNRTLLANIDRLLVQLCEGVELFILDNASREPVAETLAPALARCPDAANIHVLRHRANVGAAANILRSFEVARSPWVWILGDDDLVSFTAVADILRAIEARPDVAFFNFSTEEMKQLGQRLSTFDTRGQAGFVEGMDHAGNVNFMSVSIWNVAAVLPWLSKAYFYAYSMSYPFVLLLSALGEDKVCHFSSHVLINKVTTAEAATKWPFRDFILGWNTILELPMSGATRHTLSRKMMSWHSPENVCVYLLADAALQGRGMRDYLMISRRLASHVNGFERLRFFLYRVFFLAPTLGWRVVQAAVKLAVRLKIKGVDLDDIIARSSQLADDRR